jgi:hypothetical protein
METIETTPSSIQPMEEDKYWPLIEDSLINTRPNVEHEELNDYILQRLESMPTEKVLEFYLRTCQLVDALYTSELWCAANIMNLGWCSDDGFEYFRLWIIGRGEKTYNNAKINPDSLADELVYGRTIYWNERFSYLPAEALRNTGRGDLYELLRDVNFESSEDVNDKSDITFNWSTEHPKTMKAICPKLFKLLWHKRRS